MATNLEEKMDVVPNDNYILKTMNKPMNEEWKVSDGKIVKTEELKWRTGAATFWTLTLMPVVLLLFALLVNFKVFRPFLWIQESLSVTISWWFVACVLVLQISCIPLSIMHFRCAKVYVVPFQNGLKQLMHILHPRQFIWIVTMGLVGLIHAIVLGSLVYEQIQTDICQNGKSCINSVVKSLLIFGILVGFRSGILFYTEKNYAIEFPVVQEKRFFRTRSSLLSCLKTSFMSCLQSIKLFYVVQIAYGITSNFFNAILSGNDDRSPMLSSAWPLLSLSFLWLCLAIGFAILLTMNLTQCLFNIFITQGYTFILETDFVGDHRLLLQETLPASNQILKHLAFLDLCQIGKFDIRRRKQVFAITQPGGHPENWNMIVSNCLLVIDQSKQRFDQANIQEIRKNQIKTGSCLFNPNQSKILSPVPLAEFASPKPNLTQLTAFLSAQKSWNATEEIQSPNRHRLAQSKQANKETALWTHLPFMSGLFEERHDFKLESLCVDHQLIILALEGLSSLVAASYNEDTYGVVQRTLPQILLSLLTYLETIEKYLKTTVTDDKLEINKLKEFQKRKATTNKAQSYKLAVQSAIYRITTQFGSNLESVRLPREYRKCLDSFIEFRD